MRVRPVFWLLLFLACAGILAFAATAQTHCPATLQIRMEQHPEPSSMTTITLHATDNNGLPIDDAQVLSSAWMTNMQMVTHQIAISPQGQGNYLVRVHLYMAGPWAIDLSLQAQGFDTLHRTLFVQVQDMPTNGVSCLSSAPGTG
jgi:hypothetical protein